MNKNNAKKGSSLIEVIISLFIVVYISVISISIIQNIYKNYKNTNKYFMHLDSIDNAMNNLDNIFKARNMISMESNSNSISLILKKDHSSDKILKKVVYLRGNTLYVATYDIGVTENLLANNVLLNEVREFQVFRKERLIYFYIETLNGIERVRCI